MFQMKQKVVCSVIAEIVGDPSVGLFGETVTISFDGGYVIEEEGDRRYLIGETKAYLSNLFGDDVRVWLYDEDGNEL